MQMWKSILGQIEQRVSPQTFDVWFRPTSQQRQDVGDQKLVVRVPNKHFEYWLTENYRDVIDESLSKLNLNSVQVRFVADDQGEATELSKQSTPNLLDPSEAVQNSNLNTEYSFSSFVVGSCNQFGHAAAVAAAEQPGKAYNPLFIYGGVGLGKTHLMHAIGHSVRTTFPRLQVTYMSSEQFMNELINAIRYDRTQKFREKYRTIDVLLMDDIQFLARKERTQEEFFHTFNALYDSQKQIVITSDAPPRRIPTLEERLHSRFEWGLIADIQPPDLETKIAILRKKAEQDGCSLPEDVIYFIASNVRSNIRELEGSLIRLMAYGSLSGEEISVELAERVLRHLLESGPKPISIEQIQKRVAEYHSIKIADLKAKNNSRRFAQPRQIAMYLAKQLTSASLPQIGREFGGKHHTTALHAIRKITKESKNDSTLRATIDSLTESIKR